jgi:hypothetical protein
LEFEFIRKARETNAGIKKLPLRDIAIDAGNYSSCRVPGPSEVPFSDVTHSEQALSTSLSLSTLVVTEDRGLSYPSRQVLSYQEWRLLGCYALWLL